MATNDLKYRQKSEDMNDGNPRDVEDGDMGQPAKRKIVYMYKMKGQHQQGYEMVWIDRGRCCGLDSVEEKDTGPHLS